MSTIRIAVCFCVIAITACGVDTAPQLDDNPPKPLQSGYTFLSAESQNLQDDDFANPGFLWVDKGAEIFDKSCTNCHDQDNMRGVAARYPVVENNRVITLERRINQCRVEQMEQSPLPHESDDLLSLTAYISHRSKSVARSVTLTADNAQNYNSGQAYFFTRRGQFNLSCAQCHNDHWGQKLRGDTISQGHSNGFPAYRLEWQELGSVHRRFADCDRGVRAGPMALGSDIYAQLELFLAVRSHGLMLEAPAIRR